MSKNLKKINSQKVNDVYQTNKKQTLKVTKNSPNYGLEKEKRSNSSNFIVVYYSKFMFVEVEACQIRRPFVFEKRQTEHFCGFDNYFLQLFFTNSHLMVWSYKNAKTVSEREFKKQKRICICADISREKYDFFL